MEEHKVKANSGQVVGYFEFLFSSPRNSSMILTMILLGLKRLAGGGGVCRAGIFVIGHEVVRDEFVGAVKDGAKSLE